MSSSQLLFEPIPTYTINLDLPPEKRWLHIVKDFEKHFKTLGEALNTEANSIFGPLTPFLSWIISKISKAVIPQEHLLELQGIANITSKYGLSFEQLLQMNIGYSFVARCTSSALQLGNLKDAVLHLRNMDWDMKCLWPLTIQVMFQRKEAVIATATTWVGFVGVLTGMRHGSFSVSLNYRYLGSNVFWNFVKFSKGEWIIDFLIRDLLCSEKTVTYSEAVKILSTRRLVAPCYLIVCGTKHGEGVIIARNQADEERRATLPTNCVKNAFIVQTNIDHWKTKWDVNVDDDELLVNAVERRSKAEALLKQLQWDGKQICNNSWLNGSKSTLIDLAFQVLSAAPVCNRQTVYQTIMIPARDIYVCRKVPCTL